MSGKSEINSKSFKVLVLIN